ncbi:unnamed protein product, partial [marine sediment metagenome]
MLSLRGVPKAFETTKQSRDYSPSIAIYHLSEINEP